MCLHAYGCSWSKSCARVPPFTSWQEQWHLCSPWAVAHKAPAACIIGSQGSSCMHKYKWQGPQHIRDSWACKSIRAGPDRGRDELQRASPAHARASPHVLRAPSLLGPLHMATIGCKACAAGTCACVRSRVLRAWLPLQQRCACAHAQQRAGTTAAHVHHTALAQVNPGLPAPHPAPPAQPRALWVRARRPGP